MINWGLRLRNKATITALLSAFVVFIYSIAKALGLELPVEQQQIMDAISALLTVLAALGIVIDPTTQGVGDSTQALLYDQPASTTGAAKGNQR